VAQELFAAQTNGEGIRTTCSFRSQGLDRVRHLVELLSAYQKILLMLVVVLHYTVAKGGRSQR
jgi:hypothetical protein